ncbi:hypothetical protein, partial [Ruminococcus champanellensis]|uniref:hypothetical protein n=1 Tax=Ruminococcus champanellensis TaxID=1161942 RepID=UPI002E7848C3
HRNDEGILAYCKEFLCDMTDNSSTDAVQSRQARFVRYCLKIFAEIWGNKDGDQAVYLPLTAEV